MLYHRAVPDAPRWKAQSKVLLALAVGIFLAAVVGPVAGLLIARRSGETLTGRVGADGTAVGTFSFAVTECTSGQAFVPGFLGADLRGSNGYDLRVAGSGDEAQLWLYPRGAWAAGSPSSSRTARSGTCGSTGPTSR